MKFVKVEQEPDLVRDMDSGAILNSNTDALAAYKNRKRQSNRINTFEDRLNNVENKLDLILKKLG